MKIYLLPLSVACSKYWSEKRIITTMSAQRSRGQLSKTYLEFMDHKQWIEDC